MNPPEMTHLSTPTDEELESWLDSHLADHTYDEARPIVVKTAWALAHSMSNDRQPGAIRKIHHWLAAPSPHSSTFVSARDLRHDLETAAEIASAVLCLVIFNGLNHARLMHRLWIAIMDGYNFAMTGQTMPAKSVHAVVHEVAAIVVAILFGKLMRMVVREIR